MDKLRFVTHPFYISSEVGYGSITLDNKKRVLVVDDEPDMCFVLKVILETNGFMVNYYYNPLIALDEFKSNFYDLIILDI